MNEMGRAYRTLGGEERRGVYRVLLWKPEGERPLEDLDLDGNLILKLIFKE